MHLLIGTILGKLIHFGGPILSQVQVIPIFYGNAQYKSKLMQFYNQVTKTAYFDGLKEYNTPTQNITRGSAPYFISHTTDIKNNLDDVADIQTFLKSLYEQGIIRPTANTYYPIHFAPDISISWRGGQSCVTFCGYHGTVDVGNGKYIVYGVLPDPTGICNGPCGSAPDLFDNLSSISSHELVESILNPMLGIVNYLDYPLGWYDPINGEISDICNQQQGQIMVAKNKYSTVQRQYSNQAEACIILNGVNS